MDSNKKTLLIFPPFMFQGIKEPYLSVPLLAGYLERQNIPVHQRDLNAEFYHRMISSASIGDMVDDFTNRLTDHADTASSAEVDDELRVNLMEALCIKDNLDWMKLDRTFCARPAYSLIKSNRLLERVPYLEDFGRLEALVDSPDNPYPVLFKKFFLEEILAEDYRVMGISLAMGSQLLPALSLARLIHAAAPNIHIVLGGASINLADEAILSAIGSIPYVHSIVRFGGGESLTNLIHSLDSPTPPAFKTNIIDCTGPEPVFPTTYTMPIIADESHPVFPENTLSLYPDRFYLPVLYSIGCYWGHCSYCSNVEQNRHHFQLKDPVGFADEIEALAKKHNHRRFCFVGECLPPDFADALADEFIKRDLNLRFWAYIRIDGRFTRDIIFKLAKAGCNKVTIGAESTDNRILKLMKKGYSRNMIFRQLEWVKEAGIELKFNIIWDFPGTTRDEAAGILADVENIKNQLDFFALFNFSLEKNSDMGRQPEQFNLELIGDATDSSSLQSMKRFYNELKFIDTAGMSTTEKASLLPAFQKISVEIINRQTKRELGLEEGMNSPWHTIVDAARKFIVFQEIPSTAPSGSNRFYCYNFLGSTLKIIDHQRHSLLYTLINNDSDSLEALAADIAKSDRQPLRLTMRKLTRVIEEYVIP